MAEVAQICDQLIFIDRGRILLRDRVDAVVARVRSRQIDVEFELPVTLERFEGMRPVLHEVSALSDRRFRLVFDGTTEARSTLLSGCRALGTVLSFANSSLLLEEAYLDLMAPNRAG